MSLDLFVYTRKRGTHRELRKSERGVRVGNWLYDKAHRLHFGFLRRIAGGITSRYESMDPRTLYMHMENNDVPVIYFNLPQCRHTEVPVEVIKDFIKELGRDIKEGEVSLDHCRDCDVDDLKSMRVRFRKLVREHGEDDVIDMYWS